MSQAQIQEVFGQFAVNLGDGSEVQLVATQAIADAIVAEFNSGADQRKLAADYCAHVGIEAGSKNAKGKANVITGFLTWVEAGQPGPVVKEDPPAKDDAPAKTETETTTF